MGNSRIQGLQEKFSCGNLTGASDWNPDLQDSRALNQLGSSERKHSHHCLYHCRVRMSSKRTNKARNQGLWFQQDPVRMICETSGFATHVWTIFFHSFFRLGYQLKCMPILEDLKIATSGVYLSLFQVGLNLRLEKRAKAVMPHQDVI